MKVCTRCKKELTCVKTGITIRYGEGHCFRGDEYQCAVCGCRVAVCNPSPFHDTREWPDDELVQMPEAVSISELGCRHRDSEYDIIPDSVLQEINSFVLKGTPTGSFVSAVLRNDLKLAIGTGGPSALAAIRKVVSYMYNRVPSMCYGDAESIQSWRERICSGEKAEDIVDVGDLIIR